MSEQENICKQCGGLLRFEWTLVFEQCSPHEVRHEPKSIPDQGLCPGHTHSSLSKEWERLDSEQKYAIGRLRDSIASTIISLTELFERRHPELKLTWNFTLDALIREQEKMQKG